MRVAGLIALLLALLLPMAPAEAHNRGSSYSYWTLTPDAASVRVRVPQLQLSRLQLDLRYTPDYLPQVARLLASELQLESAGGVCTPRGAKASLQAEGWVEARWSLDCPQWQGLAIRTRLFEAVAPSHLHFLRIDEAGQPPRQQVLSFAEPRYWLDTAAAPAAGRAPSSLLQFVGVGIEHILSGWDHLAFLLMLILLARRLPEIALIATSFTVAHSLTLAAAVLGWVRVEQDGVEALIGLSILLVAAENLWLASDRDPWIPRTVLAVLAAFSLLALGHLPGVLLAGLWVFAACYFGLLRDAARPLRLRLVLGFLFGLVHGFGFAGVMGQLELPPELLATGLFGFNLGVELGQLLVIALVWPLLSLLRRTVRWEAGLQQGVSAAVAGLGMYWFSIRVFG